MTWTAGRGELQGDAGPLSLLSEEDLAAGRIAVRLAAASLVAGGGKVLASLVVEEPSTACFQKGGAFPSMWIQWPGRDDWDSMEIEDLEIVSENR